MMGKRRRGRETALKLLYALDITQEPVDELLQAPWLDTVAPEAVREFSVALVSGVMAHRDEIDSLVQEWSMNWSLERIGIIERNILRFAIYELLFLTDIPPNVTINEAVEVAKRYGTDEAPSFINGILDRIKQEIETRAGETPATLTGLSPLPSA
jgi:transcription antitermination protein NusB